MKRITMKCPGTCGKTYRVTLTDEQFETQSWKCPNCGFTAPYRVIHQWNNMNDHGDDHGNQAQPEGNKTQVAHPGDGPHTRKYDPNASNKTQVAHQMIWQVADGGPRIAIPLKPGRYSVGRNSSDSPAQIKVAPDRYMSREHAILIVERQSVMTTVQIAPKKPNNPVFVNTRMLNMNECATIQTGDTITMGKTRIKVTM